MKTEIEQRFSTETNMLPELRDRFTAKVVKWIYSEAEIWEYTDNIYREFVYDDRNILAVPDGSSYAYGLDVLNKPIFIKYFDSETRFEGTNPEHLVTKKVPLKDTWAEEFITHNGEMLEVSRFVRGHLERVSRMKFKDQLLKEEEAVIQGHYQQTILQYEGRHQRLQQSLNNKGQIFFEIEFVSGGEDKYFRVRRDGTRFQLYQPLPKGITVKTLKETVRARLIKLIPQLVASSGISEPIYCVALVYDGEGNDALPPMIGIGLSSEREQWVKEHGKKSRELIWNPAEFHHYEKTHTQLDDEQLDEACDYLNSKWAEGASPAPAAKLLIEVAIQLNQIVWPESVHRTDGFFVYVVDLEGGHLRKNLKTVLGQEKVAALKAAGLL